MSTRTSKEMAETVIAEIRRVSSSGAHTNFVQFSYSYWKALLELIDSRAPPQETSGDRNG